MRHERQKKVEPTAGVTMQEASEETPEPQTQDDLDEQQQQAASIHSPNETRLQGRQRPAWLQRLSAFSPSLVLENNGSVARDHLAAERTFLAYVRTSLGCAAAGVALVQLISMTPTDVPPRLERFGKILGAVTEVFGVGIIVIAVFRYFSMQKALIDGKFPPAGVVVWIIVFAMAVITLVTFGLMLGIAFS